MSEFPPDGFFAKERPLLPTPKELAEQAASAALESLRAALVEEQDLLRRLRSLEACELGWSSTTDGMRKAWTGASKRTDAAFAAWRAAQLAVGP